MTAYLAKWALASLIMPALVLALGRAIDELLILTFWPSSIALMSLGAEERPLGYVIYVWGAAIALNIVLYLIVGLVIYYLAKLVKG